MKHFVFVFGLIVIFALSSFGAAKNFRIVASSNSPWREKGKFDWVLQINNQPKASLTLGHGVTETEFDANQRKQIMDSAAANGFFELPKQLGIAAMDIPTRSLTIVDGDKKNTVVFYDPGPIADLSDEDLEKLASLPKFLTVWATVRSLIDNPRAADERKNDQKLIEEFEKRRSRK